MKLVTFTIGSGEPRVGAINLDETRVVDLAAVDNQPYFSFFQDPRKYIKSFNDNFMTIK